MFKNRSSHRRMILTAIASVALLLTPYGIAASVTASAAEPSACDLPAPVEPVVAPTDAVDDHSSDWIGNDAAQAKLRVFWGRLNHGGSLLGSYVDSELRRLVLVSEPTAAAISNLRAAVGTADAGVPLAIYQGCHSAKELNAVIAKLSASASSRPTTPIGFGIEPRTGTVQIWVDPSSKDWAPVIAQLDPALITVTAKAIKPGSRCSDAPAHFGGADYNNVSGGSCGGCTTGFKVKRNSDNKVGTSTAGHCRVLTGWSGNLYSGTNLMGQFYNWSFGGGSDWAFISDSTYSNTIYTDPCCPNTRPVTGSTTTFVGDSVCVSGGLTTARCSLIVQSIFVTQCSGGNCADNVWAKRTAAGLVCQQGDSGGPVFTPSGSNATARGHVSFVSVPGDNNCWFNEIFRMQNAGFTVLTS